MTGRRPVSAATTVPLADGAVDTEFWPENPRGGRPETASARVFLGVAVAAIAIVGAVVDGAELAGAFPALTEDSPRV